MSVDYMNLEQIQQAKEILKHRTNGERDSLLFFLGINTGLRISDLLELTLKDLKRGIVRMNKTGKLVQLFMVNELVSIVSEYCQKNGIGEDDLIFTTLRKRNGGKRAVVEKMSYNNALTIIKEVGQELGLSKHMIALLNIRDVLKPKGMLMYRWCCY